MLFYTVSAVINTVASIVLGLFVYLKNKKAILNKIFALFCFSVAVWGSFYFFGLISESKSIALLFIRALSMAAIFIPVTYFHFITVFLNINQKKKRLVILGYLLAFIIFISGFTTLFVRDVERGISFPWYPKPGITYHLFTLMFSSFVIYSWYLMFQAIKKVPGIMNLQIKYVLIGTLIGFIGGSTSFFPVYDISIPPFGNGLVAIYIIFITLAITRYHLFDIRVILTELLVGAIGLILLIQAVTATTFWLKALGFFLLILFGVVGYFLIKSILKEIELRKELQKAYEELKKLDKAKSEFISIASHQLRTPLTVIKGYISMMLEKSYGQPPPGMEKPLQNIYTSNERLIKLVNDLLHVSRIESGKLEIILEKTSLEDIVSGVAEELQNEAKNKNISLKFEKTKKPLPQILIDKDKIRQVVFNITENAIRYTDKGKIAIKCEAQSEKCLIVVADTGEGMTKEEIGRLFGSFSRGSAGQRLWTEGAGLGLYIAKKFVEMHNGKIWAESEGKGKGSTFYIELPVK